MVSKVSARVCQQVAVNDSSVARVLPPCGGDVSYEGGSEEGTVEEGRQRDVSGVGFVVEGDVPVSKNCDGSVASNTTTGAHIGPASVAMDTTAGDVVTSATVVSPRRPSENHVGKTPSLHAPKRRCLQRQCATAGEDDTMTTVVTSSSDAASCVTTAALVATSVGDIGQCPSMQHS